MYQRGGMLVRVVRTRIEQRGLQRDPDAPRITHAMRGAIDQRNLSNVGVRANNLPHAAEIKQLRMFNNH